MAQENVLNKPSSLSPPATPRFQRPTSKLDTSSEIDNVCTRLQGMENDALRKLFLRGFDVVGLKRLKRHFPFSKKGEFFNDSLNIVEEVLAEKIRDGEAKTAGDCWNYAITSRQRNWILLLSLLGASCFIVLGSVTGLAITLVSLLCVVGVRFIPVCSALLSRLTFSWDANVNNDDIIRYSDLWFFALIGLFVAGFLITAPVLFAIHFVTFLTVAAGAAVSIASAALFFGITYALISVFKHTSQEGEQPNQSSVHKTNSKPRKSITPAALGHSQDELFVKAEENTQDSATKNNTPSTNNSSLPINQ